MNVIFARQPLPRSIFLAGPTPRHESVLSWRREALNILEYRICFTGDVFVPEDENWQPHDDYHGQIEWEWNGLATASVIVFWVPRDLDDMPGFTTNVEFGMTAHTGKILLGFPPGAPKTKYLVALAERYQVPIFHDLEELLVCAVERIS